MAELFPEKVFLEPVAHKYFDKEGNEYLSFSKVFEFISEPFDANKVAFFAGGKTPQGQEQLLTEWAGKRDEGVRVDNALLLYAKEKRVRDEDKDIEDAVKEILSHYKQPSYEQLVVYNENWKTAGTLDKLTLSSNRSASKFTISDFKCFTEFDLHKNRGWLKEPFNHLPATKFTQISLQLSYYAYHVELLTGKRCDNLFIHLVNPDSCKKIAGKLNLRWEKVYVPYCKFDIQVLLETFKDQIKEKLTNKNEFVI